MTAWTEHLKKYAADNNMTYKEAMKDEKSKTLYSKSKPVKEKKEKVVKEKKEKVVKEKPALTKEKTQPKVVKEKKEKVVKEKVPKMTDQ